MNKHNLFYYPYASFTNAQLPLSLKATGHCLALARLCIENR